MRINRLVLACICSVCLTALAAAPASGAINVDLVEDINPTGSSEPENLFAFGNLLLFAASDGTTGVEPWKSNGGGAEQVADMNTGGSSNPGTFAQVGDSALFGGFATSEPGYELYKTNGTGFNLVANINTGAGVGSNPHYLTTLGNSVIFDAVDAGGHALYRSDGNGAAILEDSDGDRVNASNPEPQFTKLGNSLIFTAYTAAEGNELWRTDGTSGGTRIVKDIRDLGDGAPKGFGRLGNEVFFAATTPDEGTELWKTDGSQGGTRLVKDIAAGTGSSAPFFGYGFAKVGGDLLFNATRGDSGSELWRTNGSANGTKLVKDIYPGTSGSNPTAITSLGKKAVFGAFDNTAGNRVSSPTVRPRGPRA